MSGIKVFDYVGLAVFVNDRKVKISSKGRKGQVSSTAKRYSQADYDGWRKQCAEWIKKFSAVITDNKVSYEEIASMLDAFMRNLGLKYALKAANHPVFISGRSADVIVNNKAVGFIGEIHPQVLNNWKLENPTIGFELDISEIFQSLK